MQQNRQVASSVGVRIICGCGMAVDGRSRSLQPCFINMPCNEASNTCKPELVMRFFHSTTAKIFSFSFSSCVCPCRHVWGCRSPGLDSKHIQLGLLLTWAPLLVVQGWRLANACMAKLPTFEEHCAGNCVQGPPTSYSAHALRMYDVTERYRWSQALVW